MVTGQEPSWLWGTGLIAFAFGLACGIGIALLFFPTFGRAKKLQEEVDSLEQEMVNYKDQVTQHFKQTSTLVQKMTESYRDVYQHLATSSQQLCQEPIEMLQLGQPDSDPDKLIGDKSDSSVSKSREKPDTEPSGNRPADDSLEENFGEAPYIPQSDLDANRNNRPD